MRSICIRRALLASFPFFSTCYTRALKLTVAVGLALLVSAPALAQDAVSTPTIEQRFYGEEGVTLEALSAGAEGRGILLFYRADRGPERPSLAVRLRRLPGDDDALAEVFATPEDADYVAVDIGAARILPGQRPVLDLTALGGWWVRNGKTNYNLEIEVRGDIYAMWGVRLFENPSLGMSDERLAATISVRDPAAEGVPDWDLRRLVPAFSGRGFVRTAYAERKCNTPLEIEPGLSPLWPFIASPETRVHQLLQQTPGRLTPPIIVDWETGEVMTFAEMVSVRGQNCSYSMYSLLPLEEGVLNPDANFETPFAFYDLSGEGQGYPNLIIRTERFTADDPWSTGMDLYDVQQNSRPVPRSVNNIRYSWRNEVGDNQWDYTVQVFGFHPYNFDTPIAGGLASIGAPSYEAFPNFVIDNEWPVVNFVDSRGGRYNSSEGTYDWNAKYIGLGYAFGWEERPHRELFDTIREGLRGEYRFETTRKPELYFSPVDNQLHLLGAEGGLWNLNNGWNLTTTNLGGEHIDSWKLTPLSEEDEEAQSIEVAALEPGHLVDLGGFLLYAQGTTLTVRQAEVTPVFSIRPPTDAASWQNFRATLAPYEGSERDPLEMQSWLDAFPGDTLSAEGIALGKVWARGERVRFELGVTEAFSLGGTLTLPVFQDLAPGSYIITYDRVARTWTKERATLPKLTVILETSPFHTFEPGALELHVRNSGTRDLTAPAALRIGEETVREWDALDVPGEGEQLEVIPWVPFDTTPRKVVLTVGERTFPLGEIAAEPTARVGGLEAVSLSVGESAPSVFVLAALFMLALVGLWWSWWLE